MNENIRVALWVFAVFCASAVFPAQILVAQTGTGRGNIQDITFDDLKLDLKKDEPFVPAKLTERVKQLHGKQIRIRGWILPSSVFQQTGIKNFILVRDNMQCCFGPGAALHDCILVEMENGRTAEFTTRPVTVEGVFEHHEFKYPDGKHYAIYYMLARSVK